MKYVFFGTPAFAATILDRLIRAGMPPCAVVTKPDRALCRNNFMAPPPVKELVLGLGASIDVLQPEAIDGAFAAQLAAYRADCGVLAAYGAILPPEAFAVFPKGIAVVHPSLLPRYRGATPIQAPILAGDSETGTTLFVMDEKVDHGPLIASRPVALRGDETYATLAQALAEASADLIAESLPGYIPGAIVPQAQDESLATYTTKVSGADGFVDLENDSPESISRMVRALNPEPGVWTMKDGKRMKILEADFSDGKLVIRKFQFEGGVPRTS